MERGLVLPLSLAGGPPLGGIGGNILGSLKVRGNKAGTWIDRVRQVPRKSFPAWLEMKAPSSLGLLEVGTSEGALRIPTLRARANDFTFLKL